jgi:hypothetical protein
VKQAQRSSSGTTILFMLSVALSVCANLFSLRPADGPGHKGNRGIGVAADCVRAIPRDPVCAMVCRPTYFSTVDNWWVANLFCSFRNYFLCLYRPGRRTPWEIRIGGVNVFAGGLLYNAKGVLVGGLGVSGDPTRPDNIAYDTVPQTGLVIGVSPSGWGHATCGAAATTISKTLPVIPLL